MAITVKKRLDAPPARNAALDALLPSTYEQVTNDSVIPTVKGIGAKFRWVRAEGKQDKRDYWWRKGLRPVKGDLLALVEGAENYSKDASGVLRRGGMQLWVEHPDNAAGRAAELSAAAASQMKIIESAKAVQSAASGTHGGVQLETERFGGVQIQQKVAPPPAGTDGPVDGASATSAVPDLLSE